MPYKITGTSEENFKSIILSEDYNTVLSTQDNIAGNYEHKSLNDSSNKHIIGMNSTEAIAGFSSVTPIYYTDDIYPLNNENNLVSSVSSFVNSVYREKGTLGSNTNAAIGVGGSTYKTIPAGTSYYYVRANYNINTTRTTYFLFHIAEPTYIVGVFMKSYLSNTSAGSIRLNNPTHTSGTSTDIPYSSWTYLPLVTPMVTTGQFSVLRPSHTSGSGTFNYGFYMIILGQSV